VRAKSLRDARDVSTRNHPRIEQQILAAVTHNAGIEHAFDF